MQLFKIKMLYLEDFLEMIEHLPSDIREGCRDISVLDSSIQQEKQRLYERIQQFFAKYKANSSKQEWKQKEFDSIKSEYYKLLEMGDEKVQIANQMHDFVERHLRKLNQELSKFKMELEADNAGITAVLEKKVDNMIAEEEGKMDRTRVKLFDDDYPVYQTMNGPSAYHPSRSTEKRKLPLEINESKKQRLLNLANEAASRFSEAPASISPTRTSSPILNSLAAGREALAVAAQQALTSTLQMQQGRRTSSFKASCEALKTNDLSVISTNNTATNLGSRVQRRKNFPSLLTVKEEVQNEEPLVVDDPDWTYDPNEPKYCLCHQVSYGEMIACDNADCPLEWFHYSCVGLTDAPKGKWFCPQCQAAMKRRGQKHK